MRRTYIKKTKNEVNDEGISAFQNTNDLPHHFTFAG